MWKKASEKPSKPGLYAVAYNGDQGWAEYRIYSHGRWWFPDDTPYEAGDYAFPTMCQFGAPAFVEQDMWFDHNHASRLPPGGMPERDIGPFGVLLKEVV